MIWLTLFLLALSLAMDAMAVSITLGVCKGKVTLREAIVVGLYFGVFQAVMPAIGFLAGSKLSDLIEPVDHWIAFALLAFIGIKMLYEALHEVSVDEADACPRGNPMAHRRLVVLAVATSIDALAAGISLALNDNPLLPAILIIGFTTFFLCIAAVISGRRLGVLFQKRATVIGGFVLILLGFKILAEHLWFQG
jgi:putative Mn2+ efflux pump MntP